MKSPAKMLKTTAAAFGLARRESDPERIEGAIADARAIIAEGEREEAAALERYRESLLTDDGQPETHLGAQMQAKIKRDRGTAMVEELTARLATVQAAEERAARQAVHDDAVAKCDAIRTRLTTEYPKLATAIRSILRDLVEAEVACERAAREAPEFGHIASPEAAVRGLDPVMEEVLERREVELWFKNHQPTVPLSDEDAAKVRPDRERPLTGAYPGSNGGTFGCFRQRVMRVRYLAEVRTPSPDYLWQSVSLPGLGAYDEDFVTPERVRSLDTAADYLGRPLRPAETLVREEHVRFEPIPRALDGETERTFSPLRVAS